MNESATSIKFANSHITNLNILVQKFKSKLSIAVKKTNKWNNSGY
jgi:hypothetical protein